MQANFSAAVSQATLAPPRLSAIGSDVPPPVLSMFAPGPRKTKASPPSTRIVPQPILRPSSIGSSQTSNPPLPPHPPPPKPPPPPPRSRLSPPVTSSSNRMSAPPPKERNSP